MEKKNVDALPGRQGFFVGIEVLMSTTRRIEIYDTTLRDGTQGEGFSLSLEDKLSIAIKLDELGVDYVEGGFPLSNPKDAQFFQEIRKANLKTAKVAAFGMTRRRGIKAEEDAGMRALLDAQTPVVTLVGKTSPFQVEKVLSVTLEENLSMIADSIRFMKKEGRMAVYDAEHFFDAFKADPGYALRTLESALNAGADVLALCDTNGGSMPEFVGETVKAVLAKFPQAVVGIHPHNDCAMAVANALSAVLAGAGQVQGTINGVGERCGNLDLIPTIANLSLKYGLICLKEGALKKLTETSRFVYETANMNFVTGQPYVGPAAFAHKGGMHVHAVQKDASTYEHVKPETVGNTRRVLVSELSGLSNIATKAGDRFNIAQDKEAMKKVLEQVCQLENKGYQFEAAEASFELLVRKQIGRYKKFFDLDHYRVVVLKSDGTAPVSEATVKLRVGDKTEHTVAEGDGPVAALDKALRNALLPHLPAIKDVHLMDYKVRVINSRDETSASVRVIATVARKMADGKRETFGTIGVSENIIDASWQALVEAYEYHLLHGME